jgi:hypothetical protein
MRSRAISLTAVTTRNRLTFFFFATSQRVYRDSITDAPGMPSHAGPSAPRVTLCNNLGVARC